MPLSTSIIIMLIVDFFRV